MADDTSILTSIKKLLGLPEDYEEFDTDVIMHINSQFATLNQLGVGPESSLFITDKSAKWETFIRGLSNINSVKSLIYFKVKLAFDPPPTSFAITSMENMAKEIEWRLNVTMENILRPPFDGSQESPAGTYLGDGEWNLTGGIDFPPQAQPGDIGVDYVSGDVWRKE